MKRITLDSELRSKLNGLTEQLEICDEHGRRLGHFLPADEYKKLFYGALAAETGHSVEDLERRHKETGGRPLAEIWKSLGRA